MVQKWLIGSDRNQVKEKIEQPFRDGLKITSDFYSELFDAQLLLHLKQ